MLTSARALPLLSLLVGSVLGEEYVRVTCDGTFVTMEYHCEDSTCGDCEHVYNFTSGACNEEDHDGETEYIMYTCDNTADTVEMSVYEGDGVAGCTDSNFLDSDESISYTSGECAEDDHGHDEHEDHDDEEGYVMFSCSASSPQIVTKASSCSDDHCDDCEVEETFTAGDCNEEDHDGEAEYIVYTCESDGHVLMTVYEGDGVAGCDDDAYLASDETLEYEDGECTEDDHGHDEHVTDLSGTSRSASMHVVLGLFLTAFAFAYN